MDGGRGDSSVEMVGVLVIARDFGTTAVDILGGGDVGDSGGGGVAADCGCTEDGGGGLGVRGRENGGDGKDGVTEIMPCW